MIPVSKTGPWGAMVGLTYDNALKMHRLSASLFTLLGLAHGIIMTLAYSASTLGLGFMLWPKGTEYPVLPATGAGVLMIVIGITSIEPVRRSYYAVFRLAHYLFIPILILIAIHYPLSMLAAGLGVGIFALASLFVIGHNVLFPAKIVSKTTVGGIYTKIVIRKKHFNFDAGQWATLRIPAISWISHPISITSFPDGIRTDPVTGDNLLTFFIKNMGPGSGRWSDALYNWDPTPEELEKSLCAVNGPYGVHSTKLSNFSEALIFAGGVGITPQISRFFDFLIAPTGSGTVSPKKPEAGREKRYAKLVWTSRNPELFEAMIDHCTCAKNDQLPINRESGQVQLYLTNGSMDDPILARSQDRLSDLVADTVAESARPKIPTIISDMKKTVLARHPAPEERPVFVPLLLCGPDALVSFVEAEARRQSDSDVQFIPDIEGFLW